MLTKQVLLQTTNVARAALESRIFVRIFQVFFGNSPKSNDELATAEPPGMGYNI